MSGEKDEKTAEKPGKKGNKGTLISVWCDSEIVALIDRRALELSEQTGVSVKRSDIVRRLLSQVKWEVSQ